MTIMISHSLKPASYFVVLPRDLILVLDFFTIPYRWSIFSITCGVYEFELLILRFKRYYLKEDFHDSHNPGLVLLVIF